MNKFLWLVPASLIVWACSENSSSADESAKEIDVAALCPTNGRGLFTDERDGHVYRYTTIGDQVWMAENLAYEKKYFNENGTELDCVCENNACYYLPFEGMYPNILLKDSLCPQGWHIPSNDEIDELFKNVGGYRYAGRILKSKTGWGNINPGEESNGTDDCGFNLEPGATVLGYSGIAMDYYGSFMSSTQTQDSSSYSEGADGVRHYPDVFYTYLFASRADSVMKWEQSYALKDHIRCIKD